MVLRVMSSENYTPILSYSNIGIPWFKKKEKKKKPGFLFLSLQKPCYYRSNFRDMLLNFIVHFLLGNICLSSDIFLNQFAFNSLINFTDLILKELRLRLLCFRICIGILSCEVLKLF